VCRAGGARRVRARSATGSAVNPVRARGVRRSPRAGHPRPRPRRRPPERGRRVRVLGRRGGGFASARTGFPDARPEAMRPPGSPPGRTGSPDARPGSTGPPSGSGASRPPVRAEPPRRRSSAEPSHSVGRDSRWPPTPGLRFHGGASSVGSTTSASPGFCSFMLSPQLLSLRAPTSTPPPDSTRCRGEGRARSAPAASGSPEAIEPPGAPVPPGHDGVTASTRS